MELIVMVLRCSSCHNEIHVKPIQDYERLNGSECGKCGLYSLVPVGTKVVTVPKQSVL